MWFLVIINMMTYDSVSLNHYDNLGECRLHMDYLQAIVKDPVRVSCSHIGDRERV